MEFREFEERWNQLEKMKEIRKTLPTAEVCDFLTEVNIAIANKEEELMDAILEVIKNI